MGMSPEMETAIEVAKIIGLWLLAYAALYALVYLAFCIALGGWA